MARLLLLLPLFAAIFVAAGCSTSSTPVPAPPYGAACADDATQCEGLSCLNDGRFPGGYCTASCAGVDCESGGVCSSDYGSPLCLDECAGPADCRTGYACWRGICRPPCLTETNCGGEGAVCNEGVCGGAECSGPGDCGGDAMCVAQRCVPVTPSDAGGMDAGSDIVEGPCGFCSGVCSDSGECLEGCVDRASCDDPRRVCAPVGVDDNGDSRPDRAVAVCLESNRAGAFLAGRCASDEECESHTCFENQCTEICNDDGDCLAGHTCRNVTEDGLSYSACWYSPDGDAIDEYVLAGQSAAANAMFPRGVVALPPDVLSVTFVLEQDAPTSLNLAFFNVFAPDSTTLYDLSELAMMRDQPIRWIPGNPDSPSEVATMLVPNTTPDRVRIQSGRYTVLSGAFSEDGADSNDIRVRALVRRGQAGGTLRIRFHISERLGFTAANASADTRLQSTLSNLQRIYTSSGITVVVDGYEDMRNNSLAVINSTDGPDSELAALFRTSTGGGENIAHVFLVRGFDGAGIRGTLGVAGGIPGPVDTFGTSHSGVAVTFAPELVGAGAASQIMAHELGHYLGLFHSTERDTGGFFGGQDPIADTRVNDRNNLMFFAISNGDTPNITLTAGQNFVIARSALVAR